jgi:quinolinate synthase
VYINTSLRTKAYAHEAVPTITCTSSNVVQTVLQAFAQVRTPCRVLVMPAELTVLLQALGSM